MTQLINIPLETYLLSERSDPVNCVICDRENGACIERCSWCSAPLALSRNAKSGRRAAQLVAVLGAGGVGKTVYLGMLMDMLVRGVGGLRATVRGPHSIALQQQTTTALASGCYPDKTPLDPEQWNWVHCLVECGRRKRPAELILADVAGEAWMSEADRPETHAALTALLRRSAAVVVLADAQRLHAGDHSADYTVLKLLSQFDSAKGGRRRDRRPLAVIFTKADTCQTALDRPSEFADAHADALLRDCQARFPNTRVFGASVVGASAVRDLNGHRRNVPLRVEPQGVVEPMGWLVSQLA